MQAFKLLMIEPVNFGYNAETAVNNVFQKKTLFDAQQGALEEFQNFVGLLRKNKVHVTVIRDTADPFTPDSIFPNNWISFHEDNSLILYPMFANNRRQERKPDTLREIKATFRNLVIHDLSYFENNGDFLEGTGSMVLDRENKIAYAAISPRTSTKVLSEFCKITNYLPVSFAAKDEHGEDIYHSNVLMCVGNRFVVICLDSISNLTEREKLLQLFKRTGKEIIDISFQQLNKFAGNMLQLKNEQGELLLVMSTRAYESLEETQLATLEKYNRILHAPLETIENCGGGSARCMMAEVFNELN